MKNILARTYKNDEFYFSISGDIDGKAQLGFDNCETAARIDISAEKLQWLSDCIIDVCSGLPIKYAAREEEMPDKSMSNKELYLRNNGWFPLGNGWVVRRRGHAKVTRKGVGFSMDEAIQLQNGWDECGKWEVRE